MPELTTVPSDTPVLTDKVWFNDLSETPDAINQCELTALQTLLSPVLASTTEVLTGTDTAKAVTPNAIAAIWEKGSDIASAGTISVGEGGFFHITGTTTITDIDPATDKAGRAFWLVFDGVLTLTHHATTLILPTGGNIVTVAGDAALFISEGSDAVRCVEYRGRYASVTTSGNIHAGNILSFAGYLALGVAGTVPRMDAQGGNIIRVLDSTSAAGAANQRFEMTAPAAPGTNAAHDWFEDNGSGKTRWMVRFQSGAAIQIAIEP